MRVAGLALRTDNATEAQPVVGKIPGLWQRFRSEDWFDRLGKLGAFGPPIGVYSAYESDASGSFQILGGREVKANAAVAAPLENVSVPAGTYLLFQSNGSLPGSVIRGWQDVWAYFERPDAPARAYTYDVEVYPDAETVEIWVAIEG
ncbi:MAG TPA: GyrI-like domain-containing protein [Gemmatimonadales bacterium]|nr:GyrI-like domain-containing protein [Gemmatimonadales bacterium]